MKKTITLFLAALFCSVGLLSAQVSFTKANTGLANSFSGVAIAVVDMNADGFDDIVHLNQGRILTIEYQKPDGSGFTTLEVGSVSGQSQWSMCVADVDNNGYNDVLAGGRYDGVKLYQAEANGSNFVMNMLPGAGIFIQGSNFADINNDGWLDVFACHDDAAGRIWGNDGTGALVEANNWINLATVPVSDNSGNYGSVWSDFDNDGDLDLYIAKCRQGVNNPADPRRINALYVNDGTDNYTEAAEAANLKIGAQSWTADFGDIDNDGDMDCFITNHDVPSMLMLNDGTGVFTDIAATSGVVVSGLPIQGIFRDFDNDGWVDIIVSGTQHQIFHNNGNLTFSPVTGLFNSDEIESFAVGDLNHDGKLDIYAGYAQVYTTPSNIPDAVWLNTGAANNHFLSVSLVGTSSNRNGVGARITIYGAWGQQIREVRSGESYGIMNSFSQNFGLGTATEVDSIVVKWPSGQVDTYFDLDADQFITLIEGTCISPDVALAADGPLTFCSGESVTLSAPAGFSNYTWSNGSTGDAILVTESGVYSVVVNEGNGCFSTSLPLVVTVDPVETPSISVSGDTLFCQGSSVELTASDATAYTWSTGAVTPSISVTETGDYSVTIQGLCAEFSSPAVHVEVLAAPAPEVFPDTVILSGDAVLRAIGDNPQWYDAPVGGTLLAEGDSLLIPSLAETTTFYVEDAEFYPGPTYFGGIPDHAGNTNFSGSQFNGQLIFDAHQPFTLNSVKVYTDTPGERTIELVNSAGTVLQALDVQIDSGTFVIPIFFNVPAANDLVLTTNAAKNMEVLGTTSPRLRRTNGPVNYPYVVPGVLDIKGSNLGEEVYYYFYNWEVKLGDTECTSARVPVEAVLTIPNGTNETPQAGRLKVYPNPGNSEVFVALPELSGLATLRVFNLNGAALLKQTVAPGQTRATLFVQQLPAGVYTVKVEDAGKVWVGKLIVQQF
ncbi:MAG: VCBS repeat-containing protein [Saprospiraceae bacterium]|nr:VCBS repeat-containing protein [Saprospiraceae bacterium]